MKIKRLRATFGSLSGETLNLGEGLNIIEAPNEAGKSTWCGFIRAMLYGISTSARDKTGYLSDKTRYRPWSGAAMEGTMDIEAGGKDITLRRTAVGKSPMQNLEVFYTGTLQSLTDVNGETLTGVSEEVFDRTCFIKQSGIRIDMGADLEKRMQSIVSAGDEHISYAESEARLRGWKNALRHNKTGLIPRLEQELKEKSAVLSRMQDLSQEMSDCDRDINAHTQKLARLRADIETHEKLSARNAKKRILKARDDMLRAEREEQRLSAELMRNGRELTRDDLTSVRSSVSALSALTETRRKAEIKLGEALAAFEAVKVQRAASPFCGISPDLAAEKARVKAEYEKKKQQEEFERSQGTGKISPKVKIPMIILGVIGVIIAAIFSGAVPKIDFSGIFVAVGAVLVIAAVAVLAALSVKKPKTVEPEPTEVEYPDLTAAQMRELASEYAALCIACDEAENAANAADGAFKSADEAVISMQQTALESVKAVLPEAADISELASLLLSLDALLEQLARVRFDKVSAQNIFEALMQNFDGDIDAPETEFIAEPIRSLEDTESAIRRVEEQLSLTRSRRSMAEGELRSLGDPAVIAAEKNTLAERLDEASEKYAAVELALAVLADANAEMQTRFSPLISSEAGKLMKKLTDGRYESLSFDRQLNGAARAHGESAEHNMLALSQGTRDQLYLALRLAMCRLLLPEEENCPIILDDALANFDDRRAESALRCLLELAEDRQIILFTCHSRERKILEGEKNVNFISL